MYQKYKINFNRVLHSIPINKFRLKSSKQLRCLSYSIPLVCVLVLLALFGVAISISDNYIGEAYADEPEAALGEGEGFEPRISLSISGATKCPGDEENEYCAYGSNLATVGKTTYSDVYGISIEGADVASYALYIKGENGGKLTGVQDAEIVSAEAENGEELNPGEWGYMLFDSLEGAETNLASTKVAALTSEDVSIVDSKDDAGTKTEDHNEVDVTKGIAFAANFAEDAPTGHYKSAVTLSLAASPKKTSQAAGFAGIYYMQDMTADVCKGVDPGTKGELEDKRDGKLYTVARIQNMADAASNKKETANCWMTSNLAFDIQEQSRKVIPEYSDVNTDKVNWAKNETTIQLGAYSASDIDKAVYTNTKPTSGASADNYQSKYGYYYSWCAATAGSCINATTDDGSGGGQSAQESICPAGWRLPTGGSGGELHALFGWQDWNDVAEGTIYNYYPAGYMDIDGARITGLAMYWTSTAFSSTKTYRLLFNGTDMFFPGDDWTDAYPGYSVRCIAGATTIDDITTMQELTPAICKNAPNDWSGSLIDKRGSNVSYTLGKLKDGNCWMTQNLRLLGGTTISTTNSDLHRGSFVESTGTTASNGTTYKLPSSSTSGFTNDATHNMYNGTNNDYGAYYSWCAATAGCLTASGTNPGADVDAGSSICPLNWQLPSSKQFQALYDKDNGSWVNAGGTGSVGNKAGRLMGGTFFPAAGYMLSSDHKDGGSYGYYWSRTANYTKSSYYLHFNNDGYVHPQNNVDRRRGLSVRCVVLGS